MQTTGGALPGGLSEDVAELRNAGLLHEHVTAGAAYGAELEALTDRWRVVPHERWRARVAAQKDRDRYVALAKQNAVSAQQRDQIVAQAGARDRQKLVIASMVSGRGPTKVSPASAQARANPAFSERNP